ncbi:MAG: DNA alkylation repair protein [Chitinophagales bacterium]|nr:DNA alkylation repair protein [Bacteroidota bacterium]MCB9255773.1 DNA alkylation repair protein [Chitinophagales bacterium]
MTFLKVLEKEFLAASQLELQEPMKKYMKNHFDFFGIQSPNRRAIFSKVFKDLGIPPKESYKIEILAMMNHPKREMQYSAIDLAIRCQKKYSDVKDFHYISELLATKSWWDTVDGIAPNILGSYLSKYPNEIEYALNYFMASNNMWWHRSCILFQLKFKQKTNQELLFSICDHFSANKEFFIRKAIGWALREYARTNPAAVYHYVDNAELSNLSIREANKHRK